VVFISTSKQVGLICSLRLSQFITSHCTDARQSRPTASKKSKTKFTAVKGTWPDPTKCVKLRPCNNTKRRANRDFMLAITGINILSFWYNIPVCVQLFSSSSSSSSSSPPPPPHFNIYIYIYIYNKEKRTSRRRKSIPKTKSSHCNRTLQYIVINIFGSYLFYIARNLQRYFTRIPFLVL
jgi:hypothetical protein